MGAPCSQWIARSPVRNKQRWPAAHRSVRSHKMATCPHCQRDSIGPIAGHLKWRRGPVTCPECGGHCYRDGEWTKADYLLIATVGAFVGGGPLILIFGPWWAIFLPIAAIVGLFVWRAIELGRRPLLLGPPQRGLDL